MTIVYRNNRVLPDRRVKLYGVHCEYEGCMWSL